MKEKERPDPPLEEIGKIRDKLFAEHGHDRWRLYEHLMEDQERFADRLVTPPPREQPTKKPAA